MRRGLFAATLVVALLGGATAEAAPKITTLSSRAVRPDGRCLGLVQGLRLGRNAVVARVAVRVRAVGLRAGKVVKAKRTLGRC